MRFVALALILLSPAAWAANWNIATGAGNPFDCQDPDGTADVVEPGDTITLLGPTRTGRLILDNCWGDEDNPIVVRNDTSDDEPLTITMTTGTSSPAINIRSGDWVTLDGTGGWVGMDPDATCGVDGDDGCGIRIVPTEAARPQRFLLIDSLTAAANRAGAIPLCTTGAEPECYGGARGIEIRGVLVDAYATYSGGLGTRVGMYCHNITSPLSDFPGGWREDFILEDMVFKGIYGEGIYCGNNQYECGDVTGTAQAGAASTITVASGASAVNDYYNTSQIVITSGTGSGQTRDITDYVGSTKVATVSPAWSTQPTSSSVYRIERACVPNRNMTIRNVLVQDAGREGINPKMWVSGVNTISGSKVTNAGSRGAAEQGVCVFLGNSYANVFDNEISGCAGDGIGFSPREDMNAAGPYEFNIYNNVIDTVGEAGTADRRNGIRIAVGAGSEEVTPSIYNNTIPDAPEDAIFLDDTTDAIIRNNVLTGASVTSACEAIDDRGAGTVKTGNVCGTTAAMKFTSATDFRPLGGVSPSPAIDAASSAPISVTDLLGTLRPQGATGFGGTADAGAYEYIYPPVPDLDPFRRLRGLQR